LSAVRCIIQYPTPSPFNGFHIANNTSHADDNLRFFFFPHSKIGNYISKWHTEEGSSTAAILAAVPWGQMKCQKNLI